MKIKPEQILESFVYWTNTMNTPAGPAFAITGAFACLPGCLPGSLPGCLPGCLPGFLPRTFRWCLLGDSFEVLIFINHICKQEYWECLLHTLPKEASSPYIPKNRSQTDALEARWYFSCPFSHAHCVFLTFPFYYTLGTPVFLTFFPDTPPSTYV